MHRKIVGCAALMTIIACGGSRPPPPPPPPPKIEVAGRVLDAFSRPVQGVNVAIKGQDPVLTDERGGFKIGNVATPYELTVIDRESQGPAVLLVYDGLTRTDPTLFTMPRHLATGSISGQISGPNSGQNNGAVAFSAPDAADAIATSVPISAEGKFSFSEASAISWLGPEAVGGTLHAIQWQMGNSGPVAYSYGRKDVARLEPGASLENQDVELHSVESNELRGSIAQGAFTLKDISVYVSIDEESLLPLLVDSSPQSRFSYKVPNIADAACLVVVRAESASGLLISREWGDCNGDWAFTLNESAPQLLNPVDGFAGFSRDNALAWSGRGLLYQIDVVPADSQFPRYVLRTSKQAINLPDVSSAGVSLPPSASYSWQVRTLYTVSNIDEFTSSEQVLNALEAFTGKPILESSLPLQFELVQGESGTWRFTTGP